MDEATKEFHKKWMSIAIEEAKQGRAEGGIPIGMFTYSQRICFKQLNKKKVTLMNLMW